MIAILALAGWCQDADLASDLKARGWAAVDAWSARPEAKERLAAAAGSADPDLRWWAGAALAELEARDACLPPLRVTLEEKDRPASELLREVLGTAGLRLAAPGEADRTVRAGFRDVPFLEALDEACRLGEVSLARQPSGEFQSVPGDSIKGPRFYRGGFAAGIAAASATSEATFDDPPASRLSVTIVVRGDPRSVIPETGGEVVILEARDDTGKSLLLPGGPPLEGSAGAFAARVREPVLTAKATFDVPAPSARSIARLRGVATLTTVRKREEIVFEKVLSEGPQTREAGPVRATLARCARDGASHAVDLDLRSERRARWPDSDAVLLEDAQGNAFPEPLGSANSGQTRAEYRLTYRDREGNGPPERLRLSVVTETATRKVYFELKDVRLR
jgi:hypothetical protein